MQRRSGWSLRVGIPLLVLLTVANSGYDVRLAHGLEASPQPIPSLVPVDAFNATIYAADAAYFYGNNSSSRLARFRTQDHEVSIGYDFGTGKSVANVWTTSVEGEVFAMIWESASELYDLYRSTNYGETFIKVLRLGDDGISGQSSRVRLMPRGFCEVMIGSARRLLVGEYNINRERVSGSTNDQVRVMQSLDGATWTPLYIFNTDGVHQTRHIHVITQDPMSGWIYFGLGDSQSESAILAWDGVAAWPETKLALKEFRGLEGFYASSSSKGVPRVIVTDIIFPPHDPFLYVGIDASPSSIQRYSRDLTFNERVYPAAEQGEYTGSPLRNGVLATAPNGAVVQIWHDIGNPATDPAWLNMDVPPSDDNFVTFYVSSQGSFGPGAWEAVGRYNLSKPGKQVPREFFVYKNQLYFSAFNPAGNSNAITAVFQVGSAFSRERRETLSPAFWVATDGDNGNNGQSVRTAWRTVPRFADQAVPYGSVILIAAGEYSVVNDLVLDFSNATRSSPAGSEVVIRGQGSGVTTIAFGPGATYGFRSKEPDSDRFVLEMLTTTGHWGVNHYGSMTDDVLLGGAGIDTIYGYAGDDLLDGGPGDDRLVGDRGQDTFLFTGANGTDTIADFDINNDLIRLVGYGIDNISELFMTQQAPDAVIDLTPSGGGWIVLTGVNIDQLSSSHFTFEPSVFLSR